MLIGVIGDMHHCWDATDVSYFDGSDYDLLLFVGDLGGYTHRGGLAMARAMSDLRMPALMIPGNHDGVHVLQLVSELSPHAKSLRRNLGRYQQRRCSQLDRCLGSIELGGYSLHKYEFRGERLNVIVARPHSMGGPHLAFKNHLRSRFGVHNLEESAAKICALIDESDDAPLVILAHNGPSGLGSSSSDIWGADFNPKLGDWGDPDLRQAVDYAHEQGKDLRVVVAGHMHLTTRKGKRRPWCVEREEVRFINAARVPRHRDQEGKRVRHHVKITLVGGETTADEMYV